LAYENSSKFHQKIILKQLLAYENSSKFHQKIILKQLLAYKNLSKFHQKIILKQPLTYKNSSTSPKQPKTLALPISHFTPPPVSSPLSFLSPSSIQFYSLVP